VSTTTDYTGAIFDARMRAFQRSLETVKLTERAVGMASERTQKILDLDTSGRGVVQRVRRSRIRALDDLYASLGEEVSEGIHRGVRATAVDVAGTYQKATDKIGAARSSRIDSSFSRIPTEALDLFVQRTTAGGQSLILSPRVWGAGQVQTIELKVASAIAGGRSAKSLARDLEVHLLGGKGAGAGGSVKARTMRLARTEINTAYWEAAALSAASSQIVRGQRWNLSASHARWDACDLMAHNDAYDLGAGIYPAGAIPPRPHPNCFCFLEDLLRDFEEWGKPREPIDQKARMLIDDAALPARLRGKIGVGGKFLPMELEQYVFDRPISERLHLTANFTQSQVMLSESLFKGGKETARGWTAALDASWELGNVVTLLPAAGAGATETASSGGTLPEGFHFTTADELLDMAEDGQPKKHYKRLKAGIFELPDYKVTKVQRRGWIVLPEASSKRLGISGRTSLKVKPTGKASGLGDLTPLTAAKVAKLDRVVTEEIASMMDRYPILDGFRVRSVMYEGGNAKMGTAHAFADSGKNRVSSRRDLWINLDSMGFNYNDSAPIIGKQAWTVNPDLLIDGFWQAPARGTVRHEMGHHVEGIYRQAIEDIAKVGKPEFNYPSLTNKAAQDYASERRRLFDAYAKTDQISNYGKSEEVEFVAESIAAFTSPLYESAANGLPQEVEAFVKKILYMKAPKQ
jgi:hypothetical protein